jgi:dihydrofolate synthase/folylpolyglutamate synthase
MFHRIGAAAYKPSLDNTRELCKWLNHPENLVKTIHVGGTNGKGSTSHLIAASLQRAGYKVGLYTSPHLIDFRERIKIDGQYITEQAIIDFVIKYKNSALTEIQPSFFELTFAMAMDYFKQEKVDIAIIEVGMGGRLDSTNVIRPILSVITNVSLDHQKFLGDDIPQIAMEKSGIIKSNIPIVLGPMKASAKNIMLQKAIEQHSPLYEASLQDNAPECQLKGLYQEENKRTAYKALQIIQPQFPQLEHEHIDYAFKHVQSLTGIRGRWEVLKNQPLTIADVGHNEEGIQSVLRQVKATVHQALHVVIGMVEDKDLEKVLSLFPKHAHYYFCKANIPRGMNAEALAQIAQKQ